VVIVDAAGRVAAGYPAKYFTQGEALTVPEEAVRIWRAALEGVRNPRELAVRSGDGDILAGQSGDSGRSPATPVATASK